MSKYDKETKFYWLQLKEDFFEDDAIEWLEEQKPNGRDYAYFYLKLCLKSLKSNGILIREVGNILIPYDNKKLAELTRMDFDTVCVAMELLKKIGLVQVLENGEIYITQLENLIGSVSKGALKKQQQRHIGWTKGGQMSTKDKDKDIIKDIKEKNIIINNNIKKENEKHCYGEFKRVKLTDKEYLKLIEDYGEEFIKEEITLLDEYIESNNNKNKYSNFNLVLRKAIRENWFKEKTKKEEPLPDWYGKDFENEKNEEAEDVERRFLESLEESQKY